MHGGSHTCVHMCERGGGKSFVATFPCRPGTMFQRVITNVCLLLVELFATGIKIKMSIYLQADQGIMSISEGQRSTDTQIFSTTKKAWLPFAL